MSEIPEPPDGSVVGWGHPVDYVRVRIDEYAEGDNRWFKTCDCGESCSWATLMATPHTQAPYLLVRQELPAVDRG